MKFVDLVKEKAENIIPSVIEWREYFHKYPELSGKEKETSAFIQKVLTDLGIPFRADVFGYAVVAEIKGAKKGRTIALRADMDALPVKELTNLPYQSVYEGTMHACGHDAHMAICLGAGAILQAMKEEICGTVKLIFQPAEEEALINGAKNLVDIGILDDVDEIYGLHVWPEIPVGKVGFKKGPLMAASDRFFVKIEGKSTHGAEPHNGIDAIVAAANWIVNVESIIARETNPMDQVVCTIGTFHSGVRYNVGAAEALLEGTCRTFDPKKRDYMERRLGESLKALDMMFGTKSTIEYRRGHGATINHDDAVEYIQSVGEEYLGKDACLVPKSPSMCAEDFSYYLEKKKGAFLWLGTGFDGNPALHNASFTIDESILETGIVLMSGAVAELLGE